MIQIAIDGPAGSGKSTTAKGISKILNINYMDTGAMYRAMAYAMLTRGVDLSQERDVMSEMKDISLRVEYLGSEQHILINGEDVTSHLRLPEVSKGASAVAKIAKIREYLVDIQRKTAEKYDIVMDGRDIGTCVLKDAPVKFYLTASIRKRAQRRYNQLKQAGIDSDLKQLEDEIALRDKNDKQREVSPLRMADDAILIDNSELTEKQVNDIILSRVREVYGADV